MLCTMWYERSTDRFELWIKNGECEWMKCTEWQCIDPNRGASTDFIHYSALTELMSALDSGYKYINPTVLKRFGIKGGD